MAQTSKQGLSVENGVNFPDNTTGYITPEKLRTFNQDMIDSTVNQIVYDNAQTNLNAFTSSITASVQELLNLSSSLSGGYVTQGELADVTGSIYDVLDIIEQTTASLLIQTTNLELFTASADIRLDNLESKSASVDISITNINSFTASVQPVATSSLLITASFSGDKITYTKGDGSTFTNDGILSTASFNSFTSSFAILGANNTFTGTTNTFNNNVNILGTLTATSASFQYTTSSVVVVGQNKILLNTDTPSVRFGGISVQDSGSVGNPSGSLFWDSQNNVWIYQHPSGSGEGYNTAILIAGPANSGSIGNEQTLTAGKIPVATGEDHISDSILTQSGGEVTAAGNINATGFISASNGFYSGPNTTALNIGDGSNIRFWSGSTGGADYYNVQLVPGVGDIAFSRSGAGNVKVLTLAGTAGANTTFQNNPINIEGTVTALTINAQSTAISGSGSVTVQASTITNTAASATTIASASVRGTFDITGQSGGDGRAILLGHSGSLVLGNSTVNTYYGALAHLSSSQANANTNLIFKTNTNTADTIISGSGNIFVNPAAALTGFKRYIGGANNIFNVTGLPQISGSMGYSPNMQSNIGPGGYTFRGPASSSAWILSANLVNGTYNVGSSATLNAEKLTSGLVSSNNYIGGTLNLIANQSALTGSTTNISSNIFVGTATLAASSSAISMANSIINDASFTITNQYYSSSVGLGILNANRNNIGGQANTIIVSGSNPAGTLTGTSISDNVIFGGNNILYSDVSNARVSGTTAYHQLLRTAVIGNQLTVSGSSLVADTSTFGSAFVGRYNDLSRAKTSDVVFAVGTGNSTTRKTGFLIDSGSNTFVEGSLNVSGSLLVTGSARGNVMALSISSNTASMDLSQANYFTLTLADSTTTHISASNVLPGTSATLVITTGTNSSASLSPALLQPTGSTYAATNGSSKLDVLSFVAVNSTNMFVVATKNMV